MPKSKIDYEGRVIGHCADGGCEFRRYGGSPSCEEIGVIVDAAEQLNDDVAHGRARSVREDSAQKILGAVARILSGAAS